MEPDVRERFERVEGLVASLVDVATSHEGRLDRLTGTVDRLTGTVDRLTGTVDRLTNTVDQLANTADQLANTVDHLANAVGQLRVAQDVTQEELSALIHMMDEWIRRNPGNGAGQPPRQ